MSTTKKFSKYFPQLSEALNVQLRQNMADDYMRGMANGIIFAMSITEGREPEYVAAMPTVRDTQNGTEIYAAGYQRGLSDRAAEHEDEVNAYMDRIKQQREQFQKERAVYDERIGLLTRSAELFKNAFEHGNTCVRLKMTRALKFKHVCITHRDDEEAQERDTLVVPSHLAVSDDGSYVLWARQLNSPIFMDFNEGTIVDIRDNVE